MLASLQSGAPEQADHRALRTSAGGVMWMQGLPEGWVTDVPGLSRNAMLKALGNGVVPAQAELALRLLLELDTVAEVGDAA
jgi:DNA (cytosine-5)-methyltransferase 1